MSEQIDVVSRLFFGRDDAEHDIADGLLSVSFLPTIAYDEALSGRKTLIIGRKGSGKSAICMHLAAQGYRPGSTVLITPDEAVGEEFNRFAVDGLTDEGSKALIWRFIFALQAARFLVDHLQADHPKHVPASAKALKRFLRDNGEVDDGSLHERVARASRMLGTSISLEAFGVKVAIGANKVELHISPTKQLEIIESAVQHAFSDLKCQNAHPPLLIIVDQLEQIWKNDRESDAMIVGLLLAGKHTALTYGRSLRCINFLRTDIYDALEFSEADKFHSDEVRIDWTDGLLRQLALRRAEASLGHPVTDTEMWGTIFPHAVAGEDTPRYLFSRVLPRPRDAIQFLNLCRDKAHANGNAQITEQDVIEATLPFSHWKVLDLAREYRMTLPFLREVLIVFENSGFELTRLGIAERFAPFRATLSDKFPASADIFDPDIIIDILHGVGFLGVRRGGTIIYANGAQSGIRPTETEFIIHPCFRPYLNATNARRLEVINIVTGHNVGVVVQGNDISGDTRFR
ncbi:hypothetical protein KGQ19_01300 [Catenulispora sp. NL8]|uniref:ATP-binding protein n=1 Tax=Catenulispora pinistramenti TaxID=2705254 RepID=A0ABS5KK31_9ACTN|nr:hypothetical protein [Catenulispora pinistramenti]MBS2545496.1 hypothetical protein [Catenulispora pinistramenti]